MLFNINFDKSILSVFYITFSISKKVDGESLKHTKYFVCLDDIIIISIIHNNSFYITLL